MGAEALSDLGGIDEMQEILKTNSVEDVSWLCSLSESELNMLIGLKILVVQHTKMMGHEELAQKFNLKMLRSLGLVLMENHKEKVKSLDPGLHESATFMDSSNLLKVDENILGVEKIKECLGVDSRKRCARRNTMDEDVQTTKKAKR